MPKKSQENSKKERPKPDASTSSPATESKNYERMADFMGRCKGRVMVSINDHPDIRKVFEGFHFETTETRYTTANQRQEGAEVTGELIIMNGQPDTLGGLFQ